MIEKVKVKIKTSKLDKNGNAIYKEVEKYRFRYYYTTISGQRRQKNSKRFDTMKQAKKAEEDFIANHLNQVTPSGVKFSTLLSMYKNDMMNNNEETTLVTKMSKIKSHIEPYFKDLMIENITPLTIRQWQDTMYSKEYIKETIKQKGKDDIKVMSKFKKSYLMELHTLLSTILEYGVTYYGVSKNPAKVQGNFKRKKVEEPAIKEEENYYTFDQFNTFIEFVPNSHKDFFNFMYYTGCRPGEVFALTWDKYDGKSININQSLSRKVINGGYLLKNPKNESSIRVIDLSENITKMLNDKRSHEERKYGFNNKWFIFGTYKPLSETTIRRVADKAMLNAGLKHITLHGFRHSHASLLINGNMNVKLISSRLGHSSVTETLDTYTHMFPEQREICVNYLNEIVKK